MNELKLTWMAVVVLLSWQAGGSRLGAQDPATVSGTVVSPQGEAVDGAEVIVATLAMAAWPNVPRGKRAAHERGAGTALTDKEGRFTLKIPPTPDCS